VCFSEKMTRVPSSCVWEVLNDLASCAACKQVATDPRTLPNCLHSFCLKCLENIKRNEHSQGNLECPQCKKSCAIPDGGLRSLPKSFVIEQLKDIKELWEAPRRSSGTGSYRRTSRNTATIVCKTHDNRTIDLFCLECKVAVCSLCVCSDHKTHECLDIDDVADDFRLQMRKGAVDLTNALDKCQEMLQSLTDGRREFYDMIEGVDREIRERADQFEQAIRREKAELLKELEVIKLKQTAQLESHDAEIKQHVALMTSLKQYIEDFAANAANVDIATKSKRIRDTLHRLLRFDDMRPSMELHGLSSVVVQLASSPLMTRKDGEKESLIGKLRG
jgi:hypothetical protein